MTKVTKKDKINFLRDFKEFEKKYPNMTVDLNDDGEYSSGFSYMVDGNCWTPFESDIVDDYYYTTCLICGIEVGEKKKLCKVCKKGCVICGDKPYSYCSYCRKTLLCHRIYLNRLEDGPTNCGMIHFAQSPECWEKFKNPFKGGKSDWSEHEKIILEIRDRI